MARFLTGVILQGDAAGAVKAFSAGTAGADRFRASTDRAKRSAASLGDLFAVIRGEIGSLAKAGVALGTVFGVGALLETIKQEEALSQLNATLRSTRGAAGLTASELTNLASGLQDVTRYGDDAIIGAESLLLSFTKIGKDVFPEALETVLDMSTAMKTDLKGSAIQLGKALNDPIKGVSALAEVGVSFTQAQRDQIRALVDSGRAMESQKIILAELQTEFGGSAKAARDNLGGALIGLKNAAGDLLEADGASLPGITAAVERLTKVLVDPEVRAGFQSLTKVTLDFVQNVAGGLAAVGNFVEERKVSQLAGQIRTLKDEIEQLENGGGFLKLFGRDVSAELAARRKELAALQGQLDEFTRNSVKNAVGLPASPSGPDVQIPFRLPETIAEVRKVAEGAAPKVDKLAEANRKLLESLRTDALTESERALAQYERRIADLQQLLDAGFIGEGEFTDLAERFKEGYWEKIVGDVKDAKEQIAAIDPFEGLKDTLIDLSTDWGRATANIVSGIETISKANTGMFGGATKGWAQIADGASQYFDEGSEGFKNLQTVSQAFHAAELAMTIAELVPKAVAAVLNQGSGDPYTAFGRMAAMAAIVGALGVSVGGGGGRSTSVPRGDPGKGTGSVLGDVNATSESIARSIEQLVSLEENGLNVARSMLTTLNSIDAAIKGVAAGVARNFAITGNPTPFDLAGSSRDNFRSGEEFSLFYQGTNLLSKINEELLGFSVGGPLLESLADHLFGSSFRQIKDSGIGFEAGETLGEIWNDNIADGFYYAMVRTGTNDPFGGDHNVSEKPVFAALSDTLSQDLTNIIVGLGTAVLDAVGLLGLDVDAATEILRKTELGLDKISLQGLSGDEIEERFNAVFSDLGDRFALAALPAIAEFQQVGEGAFETLIRIASQTAYATDALQALGISIENLADPLGAARAADALAALAGGFDTFRENTSAFIDFALNDQQKFDLLGQGLGEMFAEFGMTLPDSRDGVLELVQGLDLLTEEGQNAYTAITAATPALEAFYEGMEKITAAAYDFDTAIGLNDGMDAARAALNGVGLSLDDLTAAMQRFGIEGIQSLLGSLSDAQKAVLEPVIGSILQSIIGSSTVGDYEQAQAQAARAAADEAATRMRDAVRGVLQFADGLKSSIVSLNSPEQSLLQLRNAFSGALINSASSNRNTRIAGLTDIATLGPDLQAAIIANASSAVDAQRELAKLRSDSLDAAYNTLDIDEQQLDAIHGVEGTVARSIEAARANADRTVEAVNRSTSVLSAIRAAQDTSNALAGNEAATEIKALRSQVELLRFEMQATAKNTATSAKVLSRAMQDGESLNVKTPA